MKNNNSFIYLKIAGFVIKIIFYEIEYKTIKKNILNEIKKKYKNFIFLENKDKIKIDFKIIFKGIFLDNIFLKKDYKNFALIYKIFKKSAFVSYDISIFQFDLLLKEILLKVLDKRGFIIHCSAIAYKDNNAYIFLGHSGAGKSTIASIFEKKGFKKIADDIGIIKKEKKEYFFYSSPFIEKNNVFKSNNKYILKKIFFLKKECSFKIDKLLNKEYIFKKIKKQIFIRKNLALDNSIKLILNLIKIKIFYILAFNKKAIKNKDFFK